jgi:hypothetical protein
MVTHCYQSHKTVLHDYVPTVYVLTAVFTCFTFHVIYMMVGHYFFNSWCAFSWAGLQCRKHITHSPYPGPHGWILASHQPAFRLFTTVHQNILVIYYSAPKLPKLPYTTIIGIIYSRLQFEAVPLIYNRKSPFPVGPSQKRL